jgi:sec-independent protein translocase protein TatA
MNHETLSLAISMPGGSELLLILLIVLVVFGHNRIPQLGEALGKGIKNFRKSFAKDESEVKAAEREVRVVEAEVAKLPPATPEAQAPAEPSRAKDPNQVG